MVTTQPSAFIFDMDGTLIDNMPYHTQVWVSCLAEHGAPVDPAVFHEMTAGKTNPEIIRQFLGLNIPDAVIQAISTEKEIRYRDLYRQHIQPLPGLVTFLDAARASGIRMALATSAGQENIDFVLARLGIREYFSAVVNGEEVQHGKPDPEIFIKAAHRLGTLPQDCLVFEDSPKGIESALRAGMPVVTITTSLTEAEAQDMPGVILSARDYTGLTPRQLLTPKG